MSNIENVPLQAQQQQQHPQLQFQFLNQTDCYRILDKLFQSEQSTQTLDAAFKHFEANFKSQPTLINAILDYYFDQSTKSTSLNEIPNANVHLCLSQNNKTIVDLIFSVPDDLAPKIFDRLTDKLNNSPTSSSSSAPVSSLNVAISTQHTWLKTFERALTLLCLIVNSSKRTWLGKLLVHNLFSTLVKLLKVNSNLSDQIIVESSIFFVALINYAPQQIMNSHLDNVLQTFMCLFKHYTYLEQNKVFPDGITWRSVKWSIRLFYYACYGLFPTQFIQFFRKKDHSLINKEFIRSTSFYIRFHPALMREKGSTEWTVTEKQQQQPPPTNLNASGKQQHLATTMASDDYSIEWRQYCLDTVCTNYNQVIHDMMVTKSTATSLFNRSSSNWTLLQRPHSMSATAGGAPTNPIGLSPLIVNSLAATAQIQPPLSPSSLFALSTNVKSSGLQQQDSLDQNSSRKSLTSQQQQQQQQSVPTTPNLLFNSQNSGGGGSLFQYPPIASNSAAILTNNNYNAVKSSSSQLNNNSIKNLTLEFMQNETEIIGDWMAKNEEKFAHFIDNNNEELVKKSQKKRSISESGLNRSVLSLERMRTDSKQQHQQQRQRQQAPTDDTADTVADNDDYGIVSNKLVKSEMRDRNIKEPDLRLSSEIYSQAVYLGALTSATDSSNETMNESNDILAVYLSNLKHNSASESTTTTTSSSTSTTTTTTTTSPNQTIARLKQDLNHLAIQLVYERHLRGKYEGEANRLHFIKIECEQMREEKSYLEKNLKELVEQYKSEVEACLSEQKRVEMDAYKGEIEEKELFIENLQNRLNRSESTVNDLRDKYEQIKGENQRLENENGRLMQLLEREQNLKTKNEIDQTYLKSLRYTTDLLRKKLLIMSKSQQELYQGFSSELAELAQIYNSPLLNVSNTNQSMFPIDTTTSDQQQSSASLLLTPLYQFQQSTIDMQKSELDQLRLAYKSLAVKCDETQLELEQCRSQLALKERKIDELVETLDMEVVDMKAELLRNHHRIQASLMNVNKRLEEEILKLKANLTEQVVQNKKLDEQFKCLHENVGVGGSRVLRDCEGNLVMAPPSESKK